MQRTEGQNGQKVDKINYGFQLSDFNVWGVVSYVFGDEEFEFDTFRNVRARTGRVGTSVREKSLKFTYYISNYMFLGSRNSNLTLLRTCVHAQGA